MDILKILTESKDDLYPEDLELFEVELATGDYEDSYIQECRVQIDLIRRWDEEPDEEIEEDPRKKTSSSKKTGGDIEMGIHSIAPEFANPVAAGMTPKDIVFNDIKVIRDNDSYKTKFKQYVKNSTIIDSAFIDANYSFFTTWELNAIVTKIQLGEEFLEKYFGALEKSKIARYQMFSESFFMKHYSQMDEVIVLTKGKNNWRFKANRSKQLDLFLRVKGVAL